MKGYNLKAGKPLFKARKYHVFQKRRRWRGLAAGLPGQPWRQIREHPAQCGLYGGRRGGRAAEQAPPATEIQGADQYSYHFRGKGAGNEAHHLYEPVRGGGAPGGGLLQNPPGTSAGGV